MKTYTIDINTSNNNNDNNNDIYKNYIIDFNIELSKENKHLIQNISQANNTISENQEKIEKLQQTIKDSANNNIYHNLNAHLNEDIRQCYNVKYDVYNLIVMIFVCQVFVFISLIILNSNNDRLSLTLFKYILLLFWLFNLIINYFKFYRYFYNFNIKQFNIMNDISSAIKKCY